MWLFWSPPGSAQVFTYLFPMVASAAVFILRKNLEPLTAQTPSFHRKIRNHLPQMVRQQVISDTPRFSPDSHPPHDVTGFRSHWTERPSAKRADQWRLAWQQGGLCSRCSAVTMVTMDAECCWALCVGRVWMGMTSLRESGEKQHLLQLLGLFMRTWCQHQMWPETSGNGTWFCAKQTEGLWVALPRTVVPEMI